jgi:hypothetical protein
VTEQQHSSIPFHYRARLRWDERVPTKPESDRPRQFGDPDYQATAIQGHIVTLIGGLHPKEYSIQEATELLTEKIQPLLDMGWRLLAVQVKAYSESDA